MNMVGRSIDDGAIKRIDDEDFKDSVLELSGTSENNFIFFPEQIDHSLKIPSDMKFINLTVKNLEKSFQFEYIILAKNQI